jgi:hypothetical protein
MIWSALKTGASSSILISGLASFRPPWPCSATMVSQQVDADGRIGGTSQTMLK